MRESKKRKVEEVEAPPAKRRRTPHGAAAGRTKKAMKEQRQWEAKFAELEPYQASHGDCNVPRNGVLDCVISVIAPPPLSSAPLSHMLSSSI